jgi:hypothetical protein
LFSHFLSLVSVFCGLLVILHVFIHSGVQEPPDEHNEKVYQERVKEESRESVKLGECLKQVVQVFLKFVYHYLINFNAGKEYTIEG